MDDDHAPQGISVADLVAKPDLAATLPEISQKDIRVVQAELAKALENGHRPAPQTRLAIRPPPSYAREDIHKRFREMQVAINKLAFEMDIPILAFFGDGSDMPVSHVCVAPCPNGHRDMWRATSMLEHLASEHPTLRGLHTVMDAEREHAIRHEYRRWCRAKQDNKASP